MNTKQKNNWRRLFDITQNLNQLKPWSYISEDMLFVIHLNDHQQPIVINILGEYEETFCLLTYPTPHSQKILSNLMFDSIDIIDPLSYNVAQQDALVCYFSSREELSREDYQLIKALDYHPRGKGNWIQFVKFQAGHFPETLAEKDILLLSKCYETLLPILIELKTKPKINESFYHIYQNHEGVYGKVDDFSLYDENKSALKKFENEVLIKKLRHQPTSLIQLELTYFFTNQLDDNNQVMAMIMGVDHQTEVVYFFELVAGIEKIRQTVTEQLTTFILINGRPLSISVRLEDLACQLENFCEKLKIQLIIDPDLESLELSCLSLLDVLV